MIGLFRRATLLVALAAVGAGCRKESPTEPEDLGPVVPCPTEPTLGENPEGEHTLILTFPMAPGEPAPRWASTRHSGQEWPDKYGPVIRTPDGAVQPLITYESWQNARHYKNNYISDFECSTAECTVWFDGVAGIVRRSVLNGEWEIDFPYIDNGYCHYTDCDRLDCAKNVEEVRATTDDDGQGGTTTTVNKGCHRCLFGTSRSTIAAVATGSQPLVTLRRRPDVERRFYASCPFAGMGVYALPGAESAAVLVRPRPMRDPVIWRVGLVGHGEQDKQPLPEPFLKDPLPPKAVPIDLRRGGDGRALVAVLIPDIHRIRGFVRVVDETGATIRESPEVPGSVAAVGGAKNGDLYVGTHYGPIWWLPNDGSQRVVPLSGTHRGRAFTARVVVYE